MGDGVKYGRDEDLEKIADQLLRESVGRNKRSVARDVEKMSYECGHLSSEELRFYDPVNDWDTQDSAYSVLVDPSDIENVEPTICASVPDGNVRARNPQMLERRALMRHVGDEDNWGSPREDIPFLGDNGDRKVCARCSRSKSLDLFSPDRRGRLGRDNWCKKCRMGQKRDKRQQNSVDSPENIV